MRYHDDCLSAGSVDLPEQGHDLGPGFTVQVSRRLVGQKDSRPVNKRPSDSGPLLLPSGKLARKMGQSVTEA